jgi:CheY-like chemotaxis protein
MVRAAPPEVGAAPIEGRGGGRSGAPASTFDRRPPLPRSSSAAGDAQPQLAPPAPTPAVARAASAAVPPTSASAAQPANRRRVLVLDDEPAIRTLLERALRSAGFEPVITASGVEAIERAMDGEYAALLIDHKMPDMSGIDVFQRVVARRPDIARRFVIISGEVVNPMLEAFVGTTGVALLAKPFDLDDLERIVRELDQASEPAR